MILNCFSKTEFSIATAIIFQSKSTQILSVGSHLNDANWSFNPRSESACN